MRWSLPIGRVLGIQLRLHFTFLLFIGWIAYEGFSEQGWLGAGVLVGIILTLFGIILLHELGHSIAAMHYGVTVPHITLLPIGGVASMSAIPESPWQEFVIAIGGPLVNVAIAIPLGFITGWWPTLDQIARLNEMPDGVIELIHIMNLRLLVFNLIPAFPMDGGRVLRAALAAVISYDRATLVASTLGRAIALVFIFSEPIWAWLGWSWSPMMMLIGAFVFFGAGYENRWVRLRSKLRGRTVGEIMRPITAVLAPTDRLSTILTAIHRTPQLDFPILDAGRLVGLVPRARWLAAAEARLDDPPLHTLMETHFLTIRPHLEIARLIYDHKLARQSLFPIAENGHLIGYTTRTDLDAALRNATPPAIPVTLHIPPLPPAAPRETLT